MHKYPFVLWTGKYPFVGTQTLQPLISHAVMRRHSSKYCGDDLELLFCQRLEDVWHQWLGV